MLVSFGDMTPAERVEALFGLEEDLEALLGTGVEIVEEEALRNPYVLRAVEQDRVTLYEAA